MNGCVVLCRTGRSGESLLNEFLRTIGARQCIIQQDLIIDPEGYEIRFRTEYDWENRCRGMNPDYFIGEDDFREMWCLN